MVFVLETVHGFAALNVTVHVRGAVQLTSSIDWCDDAQDPNVEAMYGTEAKQKNNKQ